MSLDCTLFKSRDCSTQAHTVQTLGQMSSLQTWPFDMLCFDANSCASSHSDAKLQCKHMLLWKKCRYCMAGHIPLDWTVCCH